METEHVGRLTALLYIIILLSVIPLVMSAPNPKSNPVVSTGLVLEVPSRTVTYGSYYQFDVHVHNATTGQWLKTGLSCELHIYNSSGKHRLRMITSTPDSNGDYEFNVDPKNFTKTGLYTFVINCNNTAVGGFYSDNIHVTRSGISTSDVSDNFGKIQMILFLGLILFFVITLLGSVYIPYKNKVNEEYKIVEVNDLKYVKIISMVLCYISVLFIMGYLDGISSMFSYLDNFSALFRYSYTIMLAVLFPIMVVTIVFMGIIFISSQKVKKALERGIPVR